METIRISYQWVKIQFRVYLIQERTKIKKLLATTAFITTGEAPVRRAP